MRLARLDSLIIESTGSKIPDSKAAFVEDIEIYLPLKGIIDPDKEKKRIEKELKEKEGFLKSLEGKLKNIAILAGLVFAISSLILPYTVSK